MPLPRAADHFPSQKREFLNLVKPLKNWRLANDQSMKPKSRCSRIGCTKKTNTCATSDLRPLLPSHVRLRSSLVVLYNSSFSFCLSISLPRLRDSTFDFQNSCALHYDFAVLSLRTCPRLPSRSQTKAGHLPQTPVRLAPIRHAAFTLLELLVVIAIIAI